MLDEIHGKKFLGFGRIKNCLNCNNEIITHLLGSYFEQKVIGFSTGYNFHGFEIVCPTCEYIEIIKGAHFWSKDEVKQKLCAELDAGKEYTKVWFKKTHEIKDVKGNYFDNRKNYLKSLNKCGAYSLVSFISS
jgi:hypothetical protein